MESCSSIMKVIPITSAEQSQTFGSFRDYAALLCRLCNAAQSRFLYDLFTLWNGTVIITACT